MIIVLIRHICVYVRSSPRAYCLLGKPKDTKLEFTNTLPGENFEVDRQCELEFGVGSKICSFMVNMDFKTYQESDLKMFVFFNCCRELVAVCGVHLKLEKKITVVGRNICRGQMELGAITAGTAISKIYVLCSLEKLY